MAQTNRDRVGRALDLLKEGLTPFVAREMEREYGAKWPAEAADALRSAGSAGVPPARLDSAPHFDAQALLTVIWFRWQEVFKDVLGRAERSLVSELRDVRNRWAHQEPFSTDDAYRALDSAARLLQAVSAPEAEEVERQKQELLRQRFEEQARKEVRRVAVVPTPGTPQAGLKPWREVAMPHPDVATGRYQQAEFAADLWQVYRQEGSDEYRDPVEFFRRTYVTEGLRQLLIGAIRRLAGAGGNPVIQLQTNFGGGKTHSMLALYHLFSGVRAAELPGLEGVLQEAGAHRAGGVAGEDAGAPRRVRRAVIVGTRISPGQSRRKPDGTEIRTLWGELAWQLAGRDGYEFVRSADETGTNPGDALRELFAASSPSLILIDEWVAYARGLYGKYDLPGGSFETHFTFAQALTEAAKHVPGTLLVVSVPASEIEIGGTGGETALERLGNAIGRVESPWRPASAEEGFEIVRRRLFQPMDAEQFRARDAVVRAFAELYRGKDAGEFPLGCREAEYERRLRAAYPIHPELFDRLYTDWSSLDRFQRTRGVLRLMAAVIHELWERRDGGLMILPSSVPVEPGPVQTELTRYVEEPWVPVIERDVDGPTSLACRIDRENPNLGRYAAASRVARTLFLGSAATFHTQQKGLEDRQIKLGCAQPGESPAIFGDALRRLADGAAHLYVDGSRYWLSPQPTVSRLAQERAAQIDDDTVWEEIRRRLRLEARERGDFAAVHPCPAGSGDVPDEKEARLVILDPRHAHGNREADSPARREAAKLLESRGSGPRIYRNALVFLAPDRARLSELSQAVRDYQAWDSILNEKEALNLDPFQTNQAKTRRQTADETIQMRVLESYQWLLVPGQSEPTGALEWEEIRLQGREALAPRAAKKLRNDSLLLVEMGGVNLRLDLDKIPLWRGDHVGVRQLVEDYSRYLYLSRLKNAEVLLGAIRDGVSSLNWEQDTFAYAGAWDEKTGRYLGLQTGQVARVAADGESLVVKSEAAVRQQEQEAAEAAERERLRQAAAGATEQGAQPGVSGAPGTEGEGADRPSQERPDTLLPGSRIREPGTARASRFHASTRLEPMRMGLAASEIAKEVVAHLTGLVGAEVEITLEIAARAPDGIPENVTRTVTENCRTLKFTHHEFEAS